MGESFESRPRGVKWVAGAIKVFERIILITVMFMLMAVVAISTFELGWLVIRDLRTSRVLLLDVEEMLELFGFFLLVLIGMELLTTLKSYLRHGVIHGEIVIEVALTALAQKIIILDASKTSGLSLLGLAALVLALACAFWAVRTARDRKSPPAH